MVLLMHMTKFEELKLVLLWNWELQMLKSHICTSTSNLIFQTSRLSTTLFYFGHTMQH